MKLEELGYNSEWNSFLENIEMDTIEPARVVAQHRDRYIVKTPEGDFDAEITGNLRYTVTSQSDYPAVGDWVAIVRFDEQKALIYSIFPRQTTLARQAVAEYGEQQIIATNIDLALIVQAVDRDFNLNRIERYCTLCYSANVEPILVLSKTDLIEKEQLSELEQQIKERLNSIDILPISNLSRSGVETLMSSLMRGKTYCLVGSSGVGKSSLINNLLGESLMQTSAISHTTNKGKHCTTHRELFVLESGAILIDNPGMREVGVTGTATDIDKTFDEIAEFSSQCKYSDCTHTSETGCAVLNAIETGIISQSAYDNYIKLEKEQEYFNNSAAHKRKKNKEFGKKIKNIKNDLKKYNQKYGKG